MATKLGRMSKHEHQFINDNVHNYTYLEIAKHLNRKPEAIKHHIEQQLGMTVSLDISQSPVGLNIQYDLEQEAIWPELKKQFSKTELDIFIYQWDQMYAQFGGDVLPTEKSQIIDTIKLEVLMNRNLREQRQSSLSIKGLEEDILALRGNEQKDAALIFEMEKQLSFFRAAQGSLGKDYRELQDRKAKMFKDIKGTRDQRIDRIQNSRETFLTWMSEIISNPVKRNELGQRMEKIRMSVLDEEIRLAAYHKYEDGNIDQPYLTAETVKDDNGRTNTIAEQVSAYDDSV